VGWFRLTHRHRFLKGKTMEALQSHFIDVLPQHVEDVCNEQRLRETYRHTLDVMVTRTTWRDHKTGSLCGIRAGTGLALACWPSMGERSAVRKLARHLKKLEAIGAAICVVRGGIVGGQLRANEYVLPGQPDAFQTMQATRRTHRQAPTLEGGYRPQHTAPGEQADLWAGPVGSAHPRYVKMTPPGMSKRREPVCQNDPENDIPNQENIGMGFKKPMGVSNRGGEADRAASMTKVKPGDLHDPNRLMQLYDSAVTLGMVGDCEHHQVQFFAMAVYCVRNGKNPCGMFVHNIKNKLFKHANNQDEIIGSRMLLKARNWGFIHGE